MKKDAVFLLLVPALVWGGLGSVAVDRIAAHRMELPGQHEPRRAKLVEEAQKSAAPFGGGAGMRDSTGTLEMTPEERRAAEELSGLEAKSITRFLAASILSFCGAPIAVASPLIVLNSPAATKQALGLLGASALLLLPALGLFAVTAVTSKKRKAARSLLSRLSTERVLRSHSGGKGPTFSTRGIGNWNANAVSSAPKGSAAEGWHRYTHL